MSPEPFNECYVDIGPTIVNGSSIFYTCDASTGEVSAVVYDDQECSDPRISVGGVDYCLSEDEDDDYGDACLEEEACSATEFCTNDGKCRSRSYVFVASRLARLPGSRRTSMAVWSSRRWRRRRCVG